MKKKDTIQNVDKFYTRATVDKNTIVEKDDEKSFWVIFATETPVFRKGWEENFNEILLCSPENMRVARLEEGVVPLLNNHDQSQGVDGQMGRVVEFVVEKGKCRARILFSTQEKFSGIWQDIKAGVIRSISTGYNVYKYLREVTEESAVPDYKAVDWEPLEISIAPVPADLNSLIGRNESVEIDNKTIKIQTSSNSNTMNLTAEEKAAQKAERKRSADIFKLVRAANLTDDYAQELVNSEMTIEEATAAIEEKRNAALTNQPAAPIQVDETQVRASERKRITDIEITARVAGVTDQTFVRNLIEKGTPLEEARTAIINKAAAAETANPAPHRGIRIAVDETDKTRGGAEIFLMQRSGIEIPKETKPEHIEYAKRFRGMTLLDLAKDCLTRAGVVIVGLDKMDIVGRAFTSHSSDFPVLLEGTTRRILLGAYGTQADTWKRFCMVGSVSDFREHKRLRMGSFGKLDKVQESGEFKTKAISDAESEKISAGTYGNVINVSRVMIINDDLQGFTRLASGLGRAAARSIEIDTYALLASNPTMGDGVALFHSTHGNLVGSGTAMSVDTFDELRVKMASQKDKDANDFLDIRPSILLCGIAKGGGARVINDAQYDPDTANKLQRPNKVRGLFSDIVDTPRITGNEYYAFADPNIEPVLEVAFLDGNQTPFMESRNGFEVDGIEWKIRHDYGVGAIGWRGAVKNPGA